MSQAWLVSALALGELAEMPETEGEQRWKAYVVGDNIVVRLGVKGGRDQGRKNGRSGDRRDKGGGHHGR